MNRTALIQSIRNKRSFLCVGLDSDIKKIPPAFLSFDDPVFEFNQSIIEATAAYAVAYKPNFAFYEGNGLKGMTSLHKTMDYLNKNHPDIFTIADAKRGDIGNTSQQYAEAVFDSKGGLNFDAITVAPYMGEDSLQPFMNFEGKWVITLALTSNKGSFDFQMLELKNGKRLYQQVLEKVSEWGNKEKLMFVVGATQAPMLAEIRNIVPHHFLLVPGVGAQGGSLSEVAEFGMNKECGLLVNASRSILFADSEHPASAAAKEAASMQQEMEDLLLKYGVL